jgi:hypothetical protein
LLLRLEISVLGAGGEAGTIFGYVGELTMAYDASLRVIIVQLLQELVERCLLLQGAGVVVFTSGVDTAFVTDADGATVVASGMGSTH